MVFSASQFPYVTLSTDLITVQMEVVPPRMMELEQLELKHSSKKGAAANILAAAPFLLECFSSNCSNSIILGGTTSICTVIKSVDRVT